MHKEQTLPEGLAAGLWLFIPTKFNGSEVASFSAWYPDAAPAVAGGVQTIGTFMFGVSGVFMCIRYQSET